MTVMTNDSFLNLREKETLVNIYYNIYITNQIRSPIFNNCHLSSVIIESAKNAHPARSNDAIKREQSHACINSAEREHLQC